MSVDHLVCIIVDRFFGEIITVFGSTSLNFCTTTDDAAIYEERNMF